MGGVNGNFCVLSLRRYYPDQVQRVTALRDDPATDAPAISQPLVGTPLGGGHPIRTAPEINAARAAPLRVEMLIRF